MEVPSLIRPVATLVGWTFFMEAWMYKTRLPALKGVRLPPNTTKQSMNAHIPSEVQWKADNYNHLHEAPTRFYAIALSLSILEVASSSGTDLDLENKLAWGYVGVRVAHSLVQAVTNVIPIRFGLYILSEVTALGLFGRLVYALV
ncbi:uncharacterized protein DNG_04335 [Cephalotrichum gorgonifer]|uniref:MAPEG family protein n=1 Tax=Cephalotrichum gorgonifer TaxID=2041049 RepID=A0AAE8MYP1_9PEZI|nr:uncharacterized protein DNG_04335 [Cephalotrichum gorgonifer]